MADVSRIDITNHVRGEMTDDCIVLTHNGEEIGHIPYDSTNFAMNAGFEMDQQRIFRMNNADIVQVDSYVEHCDGGWC
ncbi:DUF2553 family protein [Aneurinibacillus sp. Ricciae_BoGa-3]|uniref:DUF2553 family protein n=1 Tax=Aneurinibacillus sp. Ricciae_BoGa-3 TaxID=3022697 RepID=UPI00234227ED|nr:DUF2553 family protein [Aneurinibacillus sp. Ricciae_BoGa-3]WCK53948.1 DUF2553 family protein [Aneurinibacillus sp. Ricciae_BoGa-3]